MFYFHRKAQISDFTFTVKKTICTRAHFLEKPFNFSIPLPLIRTFK